MSYGIKYLSSRPEEKALTTNQTNYEGDTNGTIALLNGCATGTDFTDRVGRKIYMKSIFIRGTVGPVDTNVSNSLVRLMIIYDTEPNGALPAVTDILAQGRSESQTNLSNRHRFYIVIDKQYYIGRYSDTIQQSVAAGPSGYAIKIFRKLNLETIYDGTTNVIGSISSGALYILTLGNQAANDGGRFKLTTRIRFCDS